jgi:N-acetylneuraminic acid mutarotase
MVCSILSVSLYAFAGMALTAGAQTTAPNEWTWVGGNNYVNNPSAAPGVYGTLGTPAAGNIPGARDSAATWTDSSGNFWLFGGKGTDAKGNFGYLNDLWEFQPSTQEWTWIGGSSTLPASCAGSTTVACGQPGVYGTLGSAAAANVPGGRNAASYWTDSSGNFWLFGGGGFDAEQNPGGLNDLWEFNPTTKEWAWMGGSSTLPASCAGSTTTVCGQPGVYGTLGSAAAANIPSSRICAANWIDKTRKLWMYGGQGLDGQGNFGQLDDLWEFDPTIQQWTWMGGSSTLPAACATSANNGLCGWPAVYGTLGVPATGISPGSRVAAAGWTDRNGNFWLFGGIGSVFWEERDFSEIDQYDLWEFNPSTQQWAWMSGNSTSICGESSSEDWCGQDGIFGTQGTPAMANIPPSLDTAMPWTDTTGNLWLFGGSQSSTTNGYGFLCNDLWVFEPAANEWAWMNGVAPSPVLTCNQAQGSYGVLGTPAAENVPSGRIGAATWTDSSGNLWLFGGYGLYTNILSGGDLNDLWIYEPAAPAPEPSFEIIASPNPINIGAMGAGTTMVSVLVAGGFNSPVTLTATPATCNGVTCITGSFSPATITGAGSSTLTISFTGAAVLMAGPIPLTITATGGGISQSIQVIVDVTIVGQISAPTFSVPAGTYTTPQTVSITDTSILLNHEGGVGEFIYYSLDGTTPTASSAVYVNPITVSSTATLKAIAMDVFFNQSAVSSATYTIVTGSFSITGTAVSVAPGATTGNTSTITLTPSGGFTGVVSLSCAITPTAASDPATCSMPASATISSSGAQTVTLTVNTTPATVALNRNRRFFRPLAGGTALACILLVGIPARRRRWWSILAMLALLFAVVGGALGCGGGSNGGAGGGGGNPGTTPGTYVITVTGTSGAITQTGTVSLVVQ